MTKSFDIKPAERVPSFEFTLGGETYTFTPTKKSSAMSALVLVKGNKGMRDLERTVQLLDWFGNGLNRSHNGIPAKNGQPEVPEHDPKIMVQPSCAACRIHARLLDEDDDLELDDVIEVATWAIGESTGRPTG